MDLIRISIVIANPLGGDSVSIHSAHLKSINALARKKSVYQDGHTYTPRHFSRE
jgi:hypothetical protein